MAQIDIGGAHAVTGGGGGGGGGGQPDYENPRDATGDGLRVRLEASQQHTPKGVLDMPFLFQCPPLESFSWSREYTWSEYETLRKGTFSRPQAKGLRTVEFDTLFVDYTALWTLLRDRPGQRPNPLEYTDELHFLLTEAAVFWLRVGQEQLWGEDDVEMLATLRSLQVEERAGEVDTRYVNVSFTEWREAEIKRHKKGGGSGGGGGPQHHNVKPGESLSDLSKHYYGTHGDWKKIFAANDKRLGGHGLGPDQPILDVIDVRHEPLVLLIPSGGGGG